METVAELFHRSGDMRREMLMLLTAIVTAILALSVLAWALRVRRARPVVVEVSPMKATLERRIREGRDFTL